VQSDDARDDGEASRGITERQALPLGKFDEVRNVNAIRSQTREALKRQDAQLSRAEAEARPA
jgi:hypothetical protein